MKEETRGRPPKDDPLVGGSIRLKESHWVKFKRLGGIKWLRKQIDKAR